MAAEYDYKKSRLSRTLLVGALIFAAFGCADDDAAPGWTVQEGDGDQSAYGTEADVVVTPDGTTYVVTGESDECADLDGTCVDITEAEGRYCGDEDAQADIVVDDDGNVVEVVCYPSPEEGTPIEEITPDESGNVTLDQTESGTVVTFPEDTNGEPLKGDLVLDAERTTIYGNGTDETIIEGNIDLASNNARLRGLTVTGNVQANMNSNNSKIVLCKIQGNLQVASNGFSAISCQVFGNVQVSGNGATMVNVGVQGEWSVPDDATCDGCYSFDDADEDFVVADEEAGDPLTCGDSN